MVEPPVSVKSDKDSGLTGDSASFWPVLEEPQAWSNGTPVALDWSFLPAPCTVRALLRGSVDRGWLYGWAGFWRQAWAIWASPSPKDTCVWPWTCECGIRRR